jgi:hypothetical protein
MKRVLRPGGSLLLAFHVGDQTVHLDELLASSQPIETLRIAHTVGTRVILPAA